MSDLVHIALFLLGEAIILVGIGIKAYLTLLEKINKLATEFVALQVEHNFVIESLGKKALRRFHSPDDHHGLDGLIDKYVYRQFELSFEEWQKLHVRICAIEAKAIAENDHEMEMLAFMVSNLCRHKTLQLPRERIKK